MADGAPPRPLEKWVPASDVVSKLVMAAAVGVIGVYLTSSRDSNDLTVACHKIIDGIASINIDKPINVNVLAFKIEKNT